MLNNCLLVSFQDFMSIDTVYFTKDGLLQKTPAHNYSEFRFRTYAALAFRRFRELFKIETDMYLASLCSEPMIELSNAGASGSIFYVTSDDNFICKTVQHKEAEFLQKISMGYYLNLDQNQRTLLPKFFGLYCYSCNAKVRKSHTMQLVPGLSNFCVGFQSIGHLLLIPASRRMPQTITTYNSLHSFGIIYRISFS